MTREELARELDEMRLRAWHQMKMFVKGQIDPKACGYASIEGALLDITAKSAQEVEAKLKTWEKANPL